MSDFPITSRYYSVKTAEFETTDDKTIVYLKRRFLPQPERFVPIYEHAVTEGDRLDNIAAKYVGDPEMFWQLCDANNAMRPEELTETVGDKIQITMPDGIPGLSNA